MRLEIEAFGYERQKKMGIVEKGTFISDEETGEGGEKRSIVKNAQEG